MIRRHSAKSMSSHAVNGTIAATLTSTSSLPCSDTVSSTNRLTSSSFETSACLVTPGCTSTPTTVAPSSASLSATALPIPCAAPVTIATRLSSLPIRSSSLKLVEVWRVLVALPRVHVVRVDDLRAGVGRELFHLRDRADAVDGRMVEARLDALLHRRRRVGDIHREQHRPLGALEQERVVPDRVPRRLHERHALRQLVVAGDGLDVRALVVPRLVRV